MANSPSSSAWAAAVSATATMLQRSDAWTIPIFFRRKMKKAEEKIFFGYAQAKLGIRDAVKSNQRPHHDSCFFFGMPEILKHKILSSGSTIDRAHSLARGRNPGP